uniref:RNA ligase with polynucleotide kinase domain n=1 Tax=Pithovirus LCPAC104 TaxID=2506589 RepID=A0A481Z417_9VIRU|nr:MAG: RNA ligase with polynucleotide kinase domain [Pithovirus LCPAC104]
MVDKNNLIPGKNDYSNEEKIKIANILNIENTNSWYITDSVKEDSLYMIHYNVGVDLNKWGHLRGTIVDVKKKKIVLKIFDNFSTIKRDVINIKDFNLNDKDQYNFTYNFDGVFIRIFKYNEKVFVSSYRKFDISRSRWGNSKYFREIYKSLNAPDPDTLFDKNVKNSSYCHIFMIVDPDIIYVTKEKINKGYLVHIDTININNKFTNECKWIPPKNKITNNLENSKKNNLIYTPLKLSIEEVNNHLKYGFYPEANLENTDIRLFPGESIVLTIKSSNETKIIKIVSTSYEWRTDIRGGNPNLYNRMFILIDSYRNITNSNLLKYYDYPNLLNIPIEEIVKYFKDNKQVSWPIGENNNELDLFYNTWGCFIMSVPLDKQNEVLTFYKRFIEDKKELIRWIKCLVLTPDISDPTICNYVKSIIIEIKETIKRENDKSMDYIITKVINSISGFKLYNCIKNNKERNKK